MKEGEEDGSRWDLNSTSEKRDSLGVELSREVLKRGVVVALEIVEEVEWREGGLALCASEFEVTREGIL